MRSLARLSALLLTMNALAEPVVTLQSPRGDATITLELAGATSELTYAVSYRGQPAIEASRIALDLADGPFGGGLAVVSCVVTQRAATWRPVWGDRAEVRDACREAVLTVRETNAPGRTLRLEVRAYDEGIGLCYAFPGREAVVQRERIEFRLPTDAPAWAAYSAQGQYTRVPVSKVRPGCERPLTVELATNLVAALGEARLVDFARMKFAPLAGASHALVSQLDGPARLAAGNRSPWRVIALADSAARLAERTDLFLNLNESCAIADTAWIRPGKVMRDMSLTTSGAKQLVDFAVRRRLQYLHFDAGWYGNEYDDRSDARGVHVDPKRSKGPLDLPEVIAYAKAKGVGVLLYVNRRALEKQLDELLPLYASWGVAGVKYGFVNVGSQHWTDWLHDAVRKAAAHRLMVDVHDEYRPTGYSRTYPNLMTQEGILGDEEARRSLGQTITHVFTRCLAGPADNTFCYFNERVPRVSSHAAQLAKSVCLFSPWQYLYWYDTPAGCSDEPELAFWDALPTTWDESRVLGGEIGRFAAVARRSGSEWFVGVLHEDAQPLRYELPLDFLPAGAQAAATLYTDDPAAPGRTHVGIAEQRVTAATHLSIPLPPRGGAALRIRLNPSNREEHP